MTSSWITVATIFSIAGFTLIFSSIFEYLANIISRVVYSLRKRFTPVAIRWIKENNKEFDGKQEMSFQIVLTSLTSTMTSWIISAVVIALICFDPLLSAASLGIIIAFGYLFISSRKTKLVRKLNQDVENLIINFRSRFPIKKSIYETLEAVTDDIPEGQLKIALLKTRTSLRLNANLVDAVSPLVALPNSTLRQFCVVISEMSDRDTFDEIMTSLLKDVKSRANLLGEIRRTLTVLRITILILQIINVLAYIVSCFLPAWRSYWLIGGHYIFFLTLVLFSTFASFFVELEIKKLEEA